MFGSSTNAGLAAALGLSRPQYQGPTGLLGVLHEQLDQAGLPRCPPGARTTTS